MRASVRLPRYDVGFQTAIIADRLQLVAIRVERCRRASSGDLPVEKEV